MPVRACCAGRLVMDPAGEAVEDRPQYVMAEAGRGIVLAAQRNALAVRLIGRDGDASGGIDDAGRARLEAQALLALRVELLEMAAMHADPLGGSDVGHGIVAAMEDGRGRDTELGQHGHEQATALGIAIFAGAEDAVDHCRDIVACRARNEGAQLFLGEIGIGHDDDLEAACPGVAHQLDRRFEAVAVARLGLELGVDLRLSLRLARGGHQMRVDFLDRDFVDFALEGNDAACLGLAPDARFHAGARQWQLGEDVDRQVAVTPEQRVEAVEAEDFDAGGRGIENMRKIISACGELHRSAVPEDVLVGTAY